MDCNPPGSSIQGIILGRILEWVAIISSRDLPNPVTEPTSPISPGLADGFFTTEPPGKPDKYLYTRVFEVVLQQREIGNNKCATIEKWLKYYILMLKNIQPLQLMFLKKV